MQLLDQWDAKNILEAYRSQPNARRKHNDRPEKAIADSHLETPSI
jgi:hypothetical protein